MIQSFAGICLHQRWFELAILFLVGFIFFLRTQELLELTPEDFKIDTSEGTVLLRIRTTKTTNNAQQSLAVQDAALAGVLQFLLVRARPDFKLWSFSMTLFRNVLRSFTDLFELAEFNFVPCSFSRGGATSLYL